MPGMSSPPSIKSNGRRRSSGLQGAKPTPQLPMTTVVTPCHALGARCGSNTAERRNSRGYRQTGRYWFPLRVDLRRTGTSNHANLNDRAAIVGTDRSTTQAVNHGTAANHQIILEHQTHRTEERYEDRAPVPAATHASPAIEETPVSAPRSVGPAGTFDQASCVTLSRS